MITLILPLTGQIGKHVLINLMSIMMTDAKAKAAMEEIKRKINLSTKAIKK